MGEEVVKLIDLLIDWNVRGEFEWVDFNFLGYCEILFKVDLVLILSIVNFCVFVF